MYKSAIVVPKSEITKYAKSSEKQVGDGEKTDTLTRNSTSSLFQYSKMVPYK